MARKMKKFSEGGAQGRYSRRMADIDKDFAKDSKGKSGKALEVLEAKRAQRKADAEDDRAKRTGADRTATRKAEYDAEKNLSRTRKFGADKPAAAANPDMVAQARAVAAADAPKDKPQSFGAAFKEARARLGAGKTFTFNGKSYTTNIAGEGRKTTSSGRTGTGTGASSSRTGTTAAAAKNPPAAAAKNPPAAAAKNPPAAAAKPKESAASLTSKEAAERARVAKLTGKQGRQTRFADILGFGKANALDHRAKVAAQQERIAQEQAGRAKAQAAKNQQRAATARKEEFINRKVEGETGLQRVARINRETAAMAKGGTVKKETTMSKKPVPANKKPMPKEPITGGADTVPLTPGRKEFLKELAKRNAKPGMAKGGKATKFGAAMVKKSADTKGRAMVKKCSGGSMKKYAKGGSIDGIAKKGKTKGKMV